MALHCGIVGLPNVGKSTLFNCLSSAKAQSANFPFCTIEPNVGTITVPDERLVNIAKISKPEEVIPTTIEIRDIAGLVKGASQGEGLGNQFLANIRETDAIIHILRCFEDDNISHVDGSIDPVRDKEVIDAELQLKDLETINNRINKVEKQAKTTKAKDIRRLNDVLYRYKGLLEQGKAARELNISKDEQELVQDLHLLTNKPVLYVCNVDPVAYLSEDNAYVKQVKEAIKDENAGFLKIAAQTEAEIAELDSYEDRQAFLEDLGIEESGLTKLIHETYNLLDLEIFYTTGPKESRAWTVKRGTKAPQAAGKIHSDFERGFIRAEVIKYEDFIKYGSEHACKEAGKASIEGKNYVVKDGDLIYFRFNV